MALDESNGTIYGRQRLPKVPKSHVRNRSHSALRMSHPAAARDRAISASARRALLVSRVTAASQGGVVAQR